jgi:Histidine kinase-, DNA gyrase B-, and HSP90-like ATPase
MGFGLTICRSIAKARGGELRYEPNPGGGTIFRFTPPGFRPMAAESVVYAGRLLHLQPCSACAAPSPHRLNPRSPSIRARL